MHYWGVWHAEAPYTDYATHTGRFMSEYGFQSFPTLDTVARYAPQSEWRIDSPVMLSHQRHPRGNQLVRTYMERDFPRAEGLRPTSSTSSQLLQATVIKYGAEAHRRRWPYNAGSLYWQLDDCWPVASWSGIDYYGPLEGAALRRAPASSRPCSSAPSRTRATCASSSSTTGAPTCARVLVLRLVDFDGKELSRKAAGRRRQGELERAALDGLEEGRARRRRSGARRPGRRALRERRAALPRRRPPPRARRRPRCCHGTSSTS
jgi:beta-mannosidase